MTSRDDPPFERGLLLDIGRKHFTADWIGRLLCEMARLGLDTLQLHTSDGPGLGVACASHPEIVSEAHLTRAEVADLASLAASLGLSLMGDVDSPAHLDHALDVHPEWLLRLADGTPCRGHLDYSRPAARSFVADIVAEMCDLFPGPVFHLGGDEYLPAPWEEGSACAVTASSAPQLVAYARDVTGDPEATLHDGYLAYLNEMAAVARAHGKIPRVWNDDAHDGPVVHLDRDVQVDVWIRWSAEHPCASDYARAGHPVINANGDYLYVILTGDGIGRGPTKHPQAVAERWTPRTFMGAAGNGGDHFLAPDLAPAGAHLSIWCDTPAALTEDELGVELRPWLAAFAQSTGAQRP